MARLCLVSFAALTYFILSLYPPTSSALLLILPFSVFPLCTRAPLDRDHFLVLHRLSGTVFLCRVRSSNTLTSFKSSLKSHLLKLSCWFCVCLCVCACVRVCVCMCVRVCVCVCVCDRQTDRDRETQTQTQTDRQTDRQTGWLTDRGRDRKTLSLCTLYLLACCVRVTVGDLGFVIVFAWRRSSANYPPCFHHR